jgi:spoIIIJ-associated protein
MTEKTAKEELVHEGDIAADYLDEFLTIAGIEGDIVMDVEGDRAIVAIVDGELEQLVGKRGEVVAALQELSRLAVTSETGNRSRLTLDIGGYREKKRIELSEIGTKAANKANQTGEPVKLRAMNAYERKIVHDAIALVGAGSESEGEEPNRFIVVTPQV